AVADRAGIGLGVGKKFAKGLPRSIVPDHETRGQCRYADDIGEIRGGVVARLRHEWQPEGAGRDVGERVTGLVRRGALSRYEGAVRARSIFDHEWLAQVLFAGGGKHP